MTLKLFDEPDEPAEPAEQAQLSIASRLLYCGWAALVAAIPAITTSYSALQVTRLFKSMTDAESATAARVLSVLHISNTPLVVALGVAALLAFGLALALATAPKRRLASVGLPFSVGIPILAATPGFLLWLAETTSIDVISGRFTATSSRAIAQTAQTISILLFCSIASGLLIQGAIVVCAVISLCLSPRSRTEALSLRRAFVWAVTGTLLLVFAGAYFVVV